jgi:ABC-type phosphate transport system substrate-binding protein
VAGGLAFIYNLQADGHRITNLRLRHQTLAEIFTGHITNCDDPAITHDHGAPLPSQPITVVTRCDGAGESYLLSRWPWSRPGCARHRAQRPVRQVRLRLDRGNPRVHTPAVSPMIRT